MCKSSMNFLPFYKKVSCQYTCMYDLYKGDTLCIMSLDENKWYWIMHSVLFIRDQKLSWQRHLLIICSYKKGWLNRRCFLPMCFSLSETAENFYTYITQEDQFSYFMFRDSNLFSSNWEKRTSLVQHKEIRKFVAMLKNTTRGSWM